MPFIKKDRGWEMTQTDFAKMGDFIRDNLRLKTLPLAVKFLKASEEFPEKTRRPSVMLKKRVTICQGVTMARVYGWTVGLAKEDLICVPAMVAFGFSDAVEPMEPLCKLLSEIELARDRESARKELSSMSLAKNGGFKAILLAPLAKGLMAPDVIAIYGNPAQVMRMIQALVYAQGPRIAGNFGGKVECTEYLLAPFLSDAPRVAIPGNGDRIFSMTQDDEMVLSLPARRLQALYEGLQHAGRAIGARYPVTFYQNFQPKFPPNYMQLGKELGIF